jgi:hypothetical protein
MNVAEAVETVFETFKREPNSKWAHRPVWIRKPPLYTFVWKLLGYPREVDTLREKVDQYLQANPHKYIVRRWDVSLS